MEKLKTVDIKGKNYVEVSERVRYFSEHYPNGMISAEIISHSEGTIIMQARVTPDMEKPERVFTAYAYEKENSTFINKTSYIENCETSAVGRALGMMGIGVSGSIASAEEVANAIAQQKGEKLTDEQQSILADWITAVINTSGSPKAKVEESILKYLKIDSLDSMTTKDFNKAVAALKAKVAR